MCVCLPLFAWERRRTVATPTMWLGSTLLFQSWRKITRTVRFLVSFVHSEEPGHDNGRRLLYITLIAPRFVFDSVQYSPLRCAGTKVILCGTLQSRNKAVPFLFFALLFFFFLTQAGLLSRHTDTKELHMPDKEVQPVVLVVGIVVIVGSSSGLGRRIRLQ
ncbi:hypothetical protein EDB87DRAFT_1661021 [Lactarius vividus]|nr:hypothetical protein EDB87DRAFT_1661021 [Lactarius vividus]